MHYTILTHIYRDADHKQQYFRETHPKVKEERTYVNAHHINACDVPKFGILI